MKTIIFNQPVRGSVDSSKIYVYQKAVDGLLQWYVKFSAADEQQLEVPISEAELCKRLNCQATELNNERAFLDDVLKPFIAFVTEKLAFLREVPVETKGFAVDKKLCRSFVSCALPDQLLDLNRRFFDQNIVGFLKRKDVNIDPPGLPKFMLKGSAFLFFGAQDAAEEVLAAYKTSEGLFLFLSIESSTEDGAFKQVTLRCFVDGVEQKELVQKFSPQGYFYSFETSTDYEEILSALAVHLADPIKEVSDKRELELTAEIEKFYARADATAKANNKVEPLIRRVTEGHAKLLVKFYRSFHKDLSEHVAEFRKLNQGLMLKLEAKSVEKRPADQQPKGEVSLLNISLNDPHATSNKTSTSFVGSEIKKKTDSDKKLQGILGPYSYRVVTQLYLLTQSKELLQFQDDRSELYKLLLVILMISFEKPEAASVYLEAFLRSPIVAEETGNKEIASKITAIKDIDATKERKQHDKLNLQNFSKTARQVCEWFAGLAPTDKDKQCFEEARTIFDAKENSTHMPSSLSFFKLDKDGLPTLETFSPTPS